MILKNYFKILFYLIFISCSLYGQGKVYEGPTDESGDVGANRTGFLNGNRTILRFSNRIAIGGWPVPNQSLWPNDDTGLNTLDCFNLIVGNMVFLANDSVAVTDENEIRNRTDLDTLYCAQSSALEPGYLDLNTEGTVEWGFQPVFGYFNKLNDYPAMSNLPNSWPEAWPSRGFETKWPGEWNGRFGRGVSYADLETYYVANDAQDQENLQDVSINKFYPRPGVRIGDLNPSDITQQLGHPWGGLGVRVEARGYQWNNKQARDAIFFEFNIANISDYDLTRAVFGFYLDASNGNKAPNAAAEDQIGFFNKLEDLSFTWSKSGSGYGGGKPCASGWAFLESPGISNDFLDNDDDGLTDERRDNGRGSLVGPQDGISDLNKFLSWYNLKAEDLREHFSGDEDQDWRDGVDLNNNGVYDLNEDAGDDIGLDGVAPGDLNYDGPDSDGSECNHMPDYLEGYGCEPNFNATDISESDMLGLTSFIMFPHPGYGPPQLSYDEECYKTIAKDTLLEFFGTPSNLYCAFGSGIFRLFKGTTERLSMAQINSYEDLGGLNSAEHSAPSLYIKKKIVQGIYETDYRFAQPPYLPTLTAEAGDGKVYLSWDDKADKSTREPLLRGLNDFEGYKIYKATDVHFRDCELLVDAYGDAAGRKALFQCDLKDGITGIPEYSYFNGLGYNLGDDTGIQHFYIDENVQNGRTYYYAIVAYDYGMEAFGKFGVTIPPTENNTIVDLDENENIRFVGRNVAVVTPHQLAAGYKNPDVVFDDPCKILDDGIITPGIFSKALVKPGNVYKIKFTKTFSGNLRLSLFRHETDRFETTTGYSFYNVTEGDKLLYKEDYTTTDTQNWESSDLLPSGSAKKHWFPAAGGITSDVVSGFRLFIKPFSQIPSYDSLNSNWVTGNTPVEIKVNSAHASFFAYDYDIIFTSEKYSTKTSDINNPPISDPNNVYIDKNQILLNQSFPFYVVNRSFPADSAGEYIKLDLMVYDVNSNGVYEPDSDYVLAGYEKSNKFVATIFGIRFPENRMPSPGDVYRLNFNRALSDSIMFTVNDQDLVEESRLNIDMDKIKVVPNPYIVTNSMERAINNTGYNQQRVINFTHVPADGTIKIFTSSGVLIWDDVIENSADDGTYQWNLLTREGLEIAAGIYVYLIESKLSGDKKFGKFAVIK